MVQGQFYRLPRRISPNSLRKLAGNSLASGGGLAVPRTISSLVRMTLCGLFVLCAMITASAQFRAGVQGTISDSAGALVPDAKVVLKDTETGKTQEATSNQEGFYRITGLAPGKYE